MSGREIIDWARSQMEATCALPAEAFGHRVASSLAERTEQVRAFERWMEAEAARLGVVLSSTPAAP